MRESWAWLSNPCVTEMSDGCYDGGGALGAKTARLSVSAGFWLSITVTGQCSSKREVLAAGRKPGQDLSAFGSCMAASYITTISPVLGPWVRGI